MRVLVILTMVGLVLLGLFALSRVVGWISRAALADRKPRGAVLVLTIVIAVAIGLIIRRLR